MRVVVALVLGACHYTSPGSTTGDDATPSDQLGVADSPIDQMPGPAPTTCVQHWLDHQLSFTGVGSVDGASLGTADDERDPSVSKDQLELFYVKPNLQGGDLDVFAARRITTAQPFGVSVGVTALAHGSDNEGKLSLAGDGLIGVMTSDRNGGGSAGGLDLWYAVRPASATDAFDVSQDHLSKVNSAENESDPHLSDDGLALYFSRGTVQNILVATRATITDDFIDAAEVPAINGVDGDADPTLTADQRVIVFASNRDGTGGGDLWYATRDEKFHDFGTPIELAVLNTGFADGDPQISADGCTLYFASTRQNDYDLFIADLMP